MVLNDENKEIIERNRVEHDCMCKVVFRIRGNVRWNFAKSSEFTRHIATMVLLEIMYIHTINSGCIEINVQSWFLRVTNKGINASIVKYVDRPFRLVSALGEENFHLKYHLKKAFQERYLFLWYSQCSVRLKLEHESSRIQLSGLSVCEKDGRGRWNGSAVRSPPCLLLLAAPSKKSWMWTFSNGCFPAVLKDTWAEYKAISDVLITPNGATVCPLSYFK